MIPMRPLLILAALALGTGCAGTAETTSTPPTTVSTLYGRPPTTTSYYSNYGADPTSTTTTTVDTAMQRHFARTPAPGPIVSRAPTSDRDWAAEDLERRITRIERAQRAQEFEDFSSSR